MKYSRLIIRPRAKWRDRLHEIVYEADTWWGKFFDVTIILAILISISFNILDSVDSIHKFAGNFFSWGEWFFTILFTVEYILRLISLKRPWRYAVSFWGFIDLVAVIPTYLGLVWGGIPSLIFIRVLRLLRIFRVFKLGQFVEEAMHLRRAMKASMPKIIVFLGAVLTLMVIMASVMYSVEGSDSGFTSIPVAMYWTVVTMTTVGYGDIAPHTPLGQFIASVIMILGYGIIAVPTGIVSVEIARENRKSVSTQACPVCGKEGHEPDAIHCKFCGSKLQEE